MFPEAVVEIFHHAYYDGIAKKCSWGVCLQQKEALSSTFSVVVLVFVCVFES